jgi:Ca-activated chloride channel family protein
MNHVLMLTDGDFNVGVSSTDALVEMIEAKRESGITLAVLGFGSGNLNDAMMEAISNKGDGVYGHISSSQIADEYVADGLLSNMYFIAKDMKIQVEFNPDHVYAYRLLGYENRAVADTSFRDDAIDGGEVGAGHQVTALYELVLPGSEVPQPEGAPDATTGAAYDGAVEIAPTDLALVKIRYKDRTATVDDPAYEVAATLAPDEVAADAASLDASFQWALAIAAYAEILKESPFGDPSQLDIISQLVARPVHESYDDRVEFVGLFEQARSYFP